MTYVVSFTEFMPPPRFDSISWNSVQIEEAVTVDGPYTVIDTVSIPTDSDPAHPAERSFTTSLATLQSGWYRMTFLDGLGNRGPVASMEAIAVGESGFLPAVSDVGLEILSRTRDQYGNLIGTFNADTSPNDTQVLGIIDQVAPLVGDAIGDTIPGAMYDDARKLIAIRAAMQIETSFFSDQVNTGRSIYPQLKEQYELELARLQKQLALMSQGNSDVPVNAGMGGIAAWCFPPAPDTSRII
jgi:hypothetical protein